MNEWTDCSRNLALTFDLSIQAYLYFQDNNSYFSKR